MQVCFAKGEGGGGFSVKGNYYNHSQELAPCFFVSPPLCSLDSVKKRRRDETAVNWNEVTSRRCDESPLRFFGGGLRGTLKHEPWRFPKTVGRISSRTFQHQEFIWSTEWANFGQHRSPAAKKINQNLETDEHIQAQRHLNMKLIF